MIAANTPIIMSNYELKPAVALKHRDRVMGLGGTSNIVLSVSTREDSVYSISAEDRDPFTVGSSHPLYVARHTDDGAIEYHSLTVSSFLRRPMGWRYNCKLVVHPMDFMERALPMHPYDAGAAIYNEDVPAALQGIFTNTDGKLKIPAKFIHGAKHQQVGLLCGIVDEGGLWNDKKKVCTLRFNIPSLPADVARLCGALGIGVTTKTRRSKLSGKTFYEVTIHVPEELYGHMEKLYDMHPTDTFCTFSIKEAHAGKQPCIGVTLDGTDGQGPFYMQKDHLVLRDDTITKR